jgi:hypothetical protein
VEFCLFPQNFRDYIKISPNSSLYRSFALSYTMRALGLLFHQFCIIIGSWATIGNNSEKNSDFSLNQLIKDTNPVELRGPTTCDPKPS